MPSPSSSASVPTLSRLNIVADASLDDGQDAWALDSDEDDFAPQMGHRQVHNPPGSSTASASAPTPPPQQQQHHHQHNLPRSHTVERSFSSSSATSCNSNSSSQTSRKLAPPARPHPFPLPASTAKPVRSSSLSQSHTSSNDRGRDISRASAYDHNNERSSSSWTMISEIGPPSSIDRLVKPTDSPTLPSTNTVPATCSLAGSPPAELGSTAVEAVLRACLADKKSPSPRPYAAADPPPATPASPPKSSLVFDTTSPGDMARSASIISIGLEKKRERETSLSASSIKADAMDIVRDPFAALDYLTSPGSDGSALATCSPTPTTAIQHQQEHTRNLSRARGFNELGGPGTPPLPGSPGTAAQTAVPRSASVSSTSWKTGSRGSGPLLPWSAKRYDSFDPMTVAGEGVTMSGRGWARNSSSSSLDKINKASAAGVTGAYDVSVERDGENAPGGGQYLPLPSDSEGRGYGLRREKSVRTKRRWREFFRCLQGDGPATSSGTGPSVDLAKLRELSWNGIPSALRPIVWPLLLGYIPPSPSIRASTLSRKRKEYRKAVELAFGADAFTAEAEEGRIGKNTSSPIPLAAHRKNTEEEKIWHQISIDVPRTNPSLPLWQRVSTQRCLERLLYIWAIRHHATGYVQGMSDLATPFFQVFLSIYLQVPLEEEEESNAIEGEARRMEDVVEDFDPAALPSEVRLAIEADTYWCLGKLLDGIQENYIFAQPGITRQVRRMEELVGRIDAPLHAHLKSQQVEYIQFAFRWMNCLLMREISVQNVTRLWDTYLAEGPDAFSDFHLYVCSVFLCKWSKELRTMDFQGCIIFLQSLPTAQWSDKDAELLLSEAFVFKNLFGQTRHLGE